MSSGNTQRDSSTKFQVVYSMLAAMQNQLNGRKAGSATQTRESGSIQEVSKNEVPMIEAKVANYDICLDEKNNLAYRIIDGKKVGINLKKAKEIRNNRIKRGLEVITEKGTEISEQPQSNKPRRGRPKKSLENEQEEK